MSYSRSLNTPSFEIILNTFLIYRNIRDYPNISTFLEKELPILKSNLDNIISPSVLAIVLT